MLDRQAFPDPLILELTDRKEGWRTVVRVRRDFRYYDVARDEWFMVKAGTETDLTSTPRYLQGVFPTFDFTAYAAVIHDEALKKPGKRSDGTPRTRKDCDKLYRDALKACGAGYLHRQLKYRGVRRGSKRAWDKYRAADKTV